MRARALRKTLATPSTVLFTLLSRYFSLICAVMITCVICYDLKIRAMALSIAGRKMYAIRPGDIGIKHD